MKAIIVALVMSLSLFSCLPTEPQAIMQAESSAQAGLTLPATMSYAQLSSLLASPDSPVLLLDVRTAEEYAAGHIPGAVLAPYDALAATFTEADKNRPIVLYCRSGNRSGIAMRTLRSMGYANLSDFGGIPNWKGGLEQ